jgi:hypothetical protein
MGASLHSAGLKCDNSTRNGGWSVWARLLRSGSMVAMRGNPFLNFHRAAEASGYPALLIVSAVCLGLVVAAVALLALIPAGWVLALALLSMVVALVVLAGAMDASFSEGNEPPAERTGPRAAAPDERNRVAPLPRPRAPAQEPGEHGKAA